MHHWIEVLVIGEDFYIEWICLIWFYRFAVEWKKIIYLSQLQETQQIRCWYIPIVLGCLCMFSFPVQVCAVHTTFCLFFSFSHRLEICVWFHIILRLTYYWGSRMPCREWKESGAQIQHSHSNNYSQLANKLSNILIKWFIVMLVLSYWFLFSIFLFVAYKNVFAVLFLLYLQFSCNYKMLYSVKKGVRRIAAQIDD